MLHAPRALLCDLDGTLIDSIDLLLDSMEAAFAGRTRRPTRAEWTAGIGTPLRTQLAAWSEDVDDIELLVERYRRWQDVHLERDTHAYPHVVDVLTPLRADGVRTAIVTSKGKGMTARSLTHVGLASLFDAIVTYEDTERHKPDAAPVQHALARLAIPPERAIFLGDSPHDVHAGNAASVRTIAAEWGPFSRATLAAANPTWWAARMADVPGIVRRALGPST
jgi:pyrophosphatase PpaX